MFTRSTLLCVQTSATGEPAKKRKECAQQTGSLMLEAFHEEESLLPPGCPVFFSKGEMHDGCEAEQGDHQCRVARQFALPPVAIKIGSGVV